MGTNFYRVKKQETFNKELAKHYIEVGKLLGEDSLESMIQDLKEEIHICKRSAGWQVLFDFNEGRYYKKSRKSLDEFLNEEGYEVEDEYGTRYSPREFWNLVNEHNSSPFSSKTEYAEIVDGLRWSYDTDFA